MKKASSTEPSSERTELLARASKAIVSDSRLGPGIYGAQHKNDFSVYPDANLKRVLEIVQQDPVVRGAITTLIDRTLEMGYSFYGKDKKSREQSAIDKMGELRFDALMRPLLQHLYTYSNAFVEIVRDGEGLDAEPKELFMIDPRFVEPQVTKNGEVVRYVMKSGEDVVTWSPDDVVHLKTTPLSGSVWGDVDIKALWSACALKYHIKKLYLWQYETNDFRPLLNINSATDEQIKRFLTHMEQARRDMKSFVPIEGEVEAVVLGKEQDYSKVKELLTYLDFEILSLLQVPPIAVGLPDNTNRGNGDAQERAFNTRIKSIQGLLEDIVAHDLMPRLGFEKVTLKFNTIDDKTLGAYLEMAERMKTMGFKEDIIKDFLEKRGFDLPAGKIFEPPELLEQNGAPGKSMDMYPSRQGKQPGTANKKIGSGERGTTRPDQLVQRTEPPRYWTYDVEVNDAMGN